MNSQIHNLLMKWFSFIFILFILSIPSFTFAKVSTLNFWRNWEIQSYNGPKNQYSYDLSGADIYNKWKLIHHFSDCKWFRSATNKIDIDDFCGMSFSQIKSWKHWLYFELTADYPWSIYESGIYILDIDWKFLFQSWLFSYQKCLIKKNGKFIEENYCKYLWYKVLSNWNISVNYNIRGKIQNKIIITTK